LTFDQINNLTSVPKEPFDECLFYDLDFESCPNDDNTQFLSCASKLPKVKFFSKKKLKTAIFPDQRHRFLTASGLLYTI